MNTTFSIKITTLIACLLFWTECSFGQSILDKIDKGLKSGNNIANSLNTLTLGVNRLSSSVKRTTREFNETVQVVKGNDYDRINKIPKSQINELKIKKGKVQNLDWEPFVSLNNQLFPSAIVTLSGYRGGATPELESIIRPIGITFKSKNENISIKWEIECTDKRFFDKLSGYCLYDRPRQSILCNPEIPWNFEALAKQDVSTPISLVFRLYDEENNKVEKTASVYMRSVDDCLRYYNDTPLLFLYTAYIQEEHPEIRKILKEATDTKIVTYIDGYGVGNPPQSIDYQVAAIWKVLHDRGINYSSITTTAGGNDKSNIFSQVVRTFDKSINDRQANCVDGTVVFASILRKIGIHTVMVLVKGHCFLGYYRKRDDEKGKRQDLVFLETTALDEDEYINEAITKSKKMKNKQKASKIINQGYIKQFYYAQILGLDEFNKNKEENTIWDVIDVDKQRDYLTKPIPFYGK